jgi:hypothetical protein
LNIFLTSSYYGDVLAFEALKDLLFWNVDELFNKDLFLFVCNWL